MKTFSKLMLITGATMMIAGLASCRKNFNFRDDSFAKGRISDSLLNNATPGTIALISCCLYYESVLQKGIAAGQKWVYTNSDKYSPQNTSFDNMVKSGKYGVNCAMPAGWSYVDMNILKEGMRFWGDAEGKFANLDQLREHIEKAAVITQRDGKKMFKELFAEGEVSPGDVFLTFGHTFIYLGDDLFLAAGHDGKWHSDPTAETEDPQHAVFETWLMPREECANNNHKPTWQISFKKDYIPEFYRNREGKLVRMPK